MARALNARVILFQCPKSFGPTTENIRNLAHFFSNVERESFQLAWEPRGMWASALVKTLCAEFNLLHCVDPFDRPQVYGEGLYWRLHGRGGYRYRYSDQELTELVEMMTRTKARGGSYVFFNNIWMREDATRFQQLLLLAEQ